MLWSREYSSGLSGGGNLTKSEYDHSNLFQTKTNIR